ncbi:uncharacterized protein [Halyomorpha halys]|uniref:uncharacterized protein n=1 Tax=Halyomorpha halys TaxID=286706 RepID=UPI0006D52396|nr:uncharacterized protein LOC106677561 [Halyomorpha halys]
MGFIGTLIEKLPKLERFLFIWTINQGAFAIGYVNFIIFVIPVILDIIWIISTAGGALLGTLIFHLIINAILTLLSIQLIMAVKKENSAQVYMWIFLSVLMVVVNIIAFIVSLIIMFIGTFSTGVITTIWYIYCILIVNSYYKDMDGGPVNY